MSGVYVGLFGDVGLLEEAYGWSVAKYPWLGTLPG